MRQFRITAPLVIAAPRPPSPPPAASPRPPPAAARVQPPREEEGAAGQALSNFWGGTAGLNRPAAVGCVWKGAVPGVEAGPCIGADGSPDRPPVAGRRISSPCFQRGPISVAGCERTSRPQEGRRGVNLSGQAGSPGRRHEGMGPYSGKSSLALVGFSAPHPAAPQPRTLPPRPPGRGPRARARVAEPGGLAREGRPHGPWYCFPGGGGGGCDAAHARRRGHPGTDRWPLAAVRAGGGGGGRDVLRVHEAPGSAVDDAQQKALATSTRGARVGSALPSARGARKGRVEAEGSARPRKRRGRKEGRHAGGGGGEVKNPLLCLAALARPPGYSTAGRPRSCAISRILDFMAATLVAWASFIASVTLSDTPCFGPVSRRPLGASAWRAPPHSPRRRSPSRPP